jgi:hypothetical protein
MESNSECVFGGWITDVSEVLAGQESFGRDLGTKPRQTEGWVIHTRS